MRSKIGLPRKILRLTKRIWCLTGAISSAFTALADVVGYDAADTALIDSTTVRTLDSLVVTSQIPVKMKVDHDGNVKFDGRLLQDALRVGSEVDLTRIMLTMPGVFAGSDYSTAVSVDGGDPGHNMYSVAGAKVYYPYHFGGIFSTFNNNHYPQMLLQRLGDESSGCMGAAIRFNPLQVPPGETKIAANVGMLSSGATITQPISDKFAVTASVRASYINLLYGRWLNSEDREATRYNFEDYGLTCYYSLSENNRLIFNTLISYDRLAYSENASTEQRLQWQNVASSLQWQHEGAMPMNHTLFYSYLNSGFEYNVSPFIGNFSSQISTIGAHGNMRVFNCEEITLESGYSLSHDIFRPLEIRMSLDGMEDGAASLQSRMLSGGIWCKSIVKLSERLNITPRLSAVSYLNRRRMKPYVDCQLMAEWNYGRHTISFTGGLYTQMLHLTSISDIGLPANFWLGSDANMAPERALSAMVAYSLSEPLQLPVNATIALVGKRLYNCLHFDGSVLNFMNKSYRLSDHIAIGTGWSGGVEMTVNKSLGRFSGWGSYTWLHSRRLFSAQEGQVRASGVPEHTANVTGSYALHPKWMLSMNFAFHSGRPYTPIKSVYMINENIIMEYGKRNSANLPAYHHLDLGVSYKFASHGRTNLRHCLNFSIYNVYGHNNIESISYRYDKDNYVIFRRSLRSILRFLPSLSYSLEI